MPHKKLTPKQIRKKFGMIIICPHGERHIDKGIFALVPHTRHLCTHHGKKEFFFMKKKGIGI